ncbi:MAG: site-specific DNA-methyltransferase [bacterium]|nr:MAG: site-specific DNA-methyltransferase [bacterium]
MKTYLMLKRAYSERPPGVSPDEDDRSSEDLIEYFLERFSREGDTVFDPFAGYGTTLLVAQRMGRIPYGVERDERRVAYARSKLHQPSHMICGDAQHIESLDVPSFDVSITSPPFMEKGEIRNPLASHSREGMEYASYIQSLKLIFEQVRRLMKPGAHVVVEVVNIKSGRGVTTFSWDVGTALSEVLTFQGEVIICHEGSLFGYHHSYCLVFSNQE